MYKKTGLIIVMFLLLVSTLTCEILKGEIYTIMGSAKVMRNGETPEIELNEGDFVNNGDVIITGEKSFVDIKFDDMNFVRSAAKSVLEITSVSVGEYEIKRFPFKTKKILKKIKLNLKTGRLLSKVRSLKLQDAFEVTTPIARIGVRGTIFEVTHYINTTVKVLSGAVSVVNLQFPSQGKTIISGQSTIISSGAIPDEPALMTKPEQTSVIELMEGTSYEGEQESIPETKQSGGTTGEAKTGDVESSNETPELNSVTETGSPVSSGSTTSASSTSTEIITKIVTSTNTINNITDVLSKYKLQMNISIP